MTALKASGLSAPREAARLAHRASWPPWFVVARDPCDADNHEPGRGNALEHNTRDPSVNARIAVANAEKWAKRATRVPTSRSTTTMQDAAQSQGGGGISSVLLAPGSTGSTEGTGEVRFATLDERDAASVRLERTGMLVVELEGIGPSARGRLGEVIDEAIERALAARGAAGRASRRASGRDATLSDQLFRARRVGAARHRDRPRPAPRGLEPPRPPSSPRTARRCASSPTRRASDRSSSCSTPATRSTGAYGDPVPLRSLLVPEPASRERRSACLRDGARASAGAVDPCPDVARRAARARARARSPYRPRRWSLRLRPRRGDRPSGGASHGRRRAGRQEEPWRAWTLQLTAARGPQPLVVLEKLFAESYMPLANAIASGLDDPRARHAHDEFAATFSKGYSRRLPDVRLDDQAAADGASTRTTWRRASPGCTARGRRACSWWTRCAGTWRA